MTIGNRFLPAVEKTELQLVGMVRGTSGALRQMFLSTQLIFNFVFSMDSPACGDGEIYYINCIQLKNSTLLL